MRVAMPSRKTTPAKKQGNKSSKPAAKKPVAKAAKTTKASKPAKPAKKKPASKRPAAKPAATKRPVAKKPAPKAKATVHTKVPAKRKAAPVPAKPSVPLSIRDQKVAIRGEMKVALKKMRERERRSKDICKAITEHPSWRRSVIVAIFAPMEMEPDVELLWKYAEGKTVCYPTIRRGGLDFMSVGGPESVSVGQFGIREPVFDQSRVIPPDTFDLVLVPGAAFTANGERLGRGGGFYDRLLASPGFRAFKVGVCFDRQVLETLPLEAHDQRVHRVVTESGWLQRPDFIKAGKPNA